MFGQSRSNSIDDAALEITRRMIRHAVRKLARLRGLKVPHAIEEIAKELQLSHRKVRSLYKGEVARLVNDDYMSLRLRYLGYLERRYAETIAEAERIKQERSKLGAQWSGQSGSTSDSGGSGARFARFDGPERRSGRDRRGAP